jgi:hypothetical protein
MTPEGIVKNKVKAILKSEGWWFYIAVAGSFSTHGIPDIMCCKNGQLLGVEVKAKGKRNNTTPNQDRVVREMIAAGAWAIVVDDPQQLIDFLLEKEIGY